MATFAERIVGAAKLDVRIYEEVEADTSATGQAMTVVVLSSIAAGIGALNAGLTGLVSIAIVALLGWFIWAFLTYIIGTKILPEPQTSSNVGELLRTIGFSSSPGILRILGAIPFIGWLVSFLIGVWMLVAMVVAVRQALDYKSTGRAVGVCLIGFAVYLIVVGLAGALLGLGRGMGA